MSGERSLVLILGKVPISRLQRGLSGMARVRRWTGSQDSVPLSGHDAPSLVVIQAADEELARDEIAALRARRRGRRPSIVVLLPGEPDAHVAQALEAVGADEAVGREGLVQACLRRLSKEPARKVRSPGLVTAGAAPRRRTRRAAAFTIPESQTTIAPASVPINDATGEASAWIRTVVAYLDARRSLQDRLGSDGPDALDHLSFLHDRARSSAQAEKIPNSFGIRPNHPATPLSWPMEIVNPGPPTVAFIQTASADGLSFVSATWPAQARTLLARLEVSEIARAELQLDVKWVRRTGRAAWQIGTLIRSARVEST